MFPVKKMFDKFLFCSRETEQLALTGKISMMTIIAAAMVTMLQKIMMTMMMMMMTILTKTMMTMMTGMMMTVMTQAVLPSSSICRRR